MQPLAVSIRRLKAFFSKHFYYYHFFRSLRIPPSPPHPLELEDTKKLGRRSKKSPTSYYYSVREENELDFIYYRDLFLSLSPLSFFSSIDCHHILLRRTTPACQSEKDKRRKRMNQDWGGSSANEPVNRKVDSSRSDSLLYE